MIKQKKIKSIKKLVKETLTIPKYQRPYKWRWEVKRDNNVIEKGLVQKLLDDILEHQEKAKDKTAFRYRIGTIVIHNDKRHLNIVDGQQRITTLALILKALNYTENNRLNNLTYDHKISQQNICKNYEHIESFIGKLREEKEEFKTFLLENCEVVYIVLDNIEEAFQFFDSQNARGKDLGGYDLLKAFHLREMKDQKIYEVDEREKLNLVQQWEDASTDGFLSILFNDLYAIRKWLRRESTTKRKRWGNEDFTKDDVDHFKGINIEKYNYPYLKKIACPAYHFAIDREIFNGTFFFKYIEYYVEMYKKVFHFEKNEENKYQDCFAEKLKNISEGIESKNTKGEIQKKKISDIYRDGGTRYVFVTMLFKRVLLFYYDKFGDSDFDEAVSKCFQWAGELLGEKGRLVYSAIQKKANSEESNPNGNLFKKIKHASNHKEVIK